MVAKEKHSFISIIFVILVVQLIDFHEIPSYPFALLYLFNATMDGIAALIIYLIHEFILKENNKMPMYIAAILALQFIAIGIHLIGVGTHYQYLNLGVEFLAIINDKYESALIAIFVLKLAVLGYGGYGIRRARRKHPHYTDNPGIYVVNRIDTGERVLQKEIKS